MKTVLVQKTEKLRQYEFIYLVQPEASEEVRAKLQELVTEVISSFKGEFQKNESWGKRKLSYEIRKFSKAYYQYMLFSGLPGVTQELERVLRLRDDCLRFMAIKTSDHFIASAEEASVEEEQA